VVGRVKEGAHNTLVGMVDGGIITSVWLLSSTAKDSSSYWIVTGMATAGTSKENFGVSLVSML